MYRTPLLEVATKCVFTNTTLVSAYRGAGRPEGAYHMERMMDYAAAELGIDRFELRRRNFIRAKDIPFKSAAGTGLRQRRLPRPVRRTRWKQPT